MNDKQNNIAKLDKNIKCSHKSQNYTNLAHI